MYLGYSRPAAPGEARAGRAGRSRRPRGAGDVAKVVALRNQGGVGARRLERQHLLIDLPPIRRVVHRDLSARVAAIVLELISDVRNLLALGGDGDHLARDVGQARFREAVGGGCAAVHRRRLAGEAVEQIGLRGVDTGELGPVLGRVCRVPAAEHRFHLVLDLRDRLEREAGSVFCGASRRGLQDVRRRCNRRNCRHDDGEARNEYGAAARAERRVKSAARERRAQRSDAGDERDHRAR